MINKSKQFTFFLTLGSSFYCFYFFILLFNSIGFWFKFSISPFSLFLSSLITLIGCLFLPQKINNNQNLKNSLIIALSFVSILGISLFIAGKSYDTSWDGQTYHQNAIYILAKGYNPLQEFLNISRPLEIPEQYFDYRASLTSNFFFDEHFAKSSWIVEASIYQVTQKIEFSKVFNILLVISSFCISVAALIQFKELKISSIYLISFILAFNPVSIYQIFTFCLDGQISSIIVVLVGLLTLLIIQKQLIYSLLLIPCFIILMNLKFISLVFVLITVCCLVPYLFFSFRRPIAKKLLMSSIVSIIIGLLIVGFNPYITNTIQKGHPFYPLMGKGGIDLIDFQTPKIFLGKNIFEKLFISLITVPSYNVENKIIKINNPFSFNIHDSWGTFANPATRTNGFGGLFIIILLGSIIIAIILLKQVTKERKDFLAFSSIFWLTILLNPALWWARYIPQLWIFPFFCLVFSLIKSKQKVIKMSVNILLFLAIVNCLIILRMNLLAFKVPKYVDSINTDIKQSQEKVFIQKDEKLWFWASIANKLEDERIDYQWVESLENICPSKERKRFDDPPIVYCLKKVKKLQY